MNSFTKFQLPYRELVIDPHNTAPLLGYESILPDDILAIVEEVMDETVGCFEICGGYQIFDDIAFIKDEHRIRVADVEFNSHNIVFHQLRHSEQIAVFVCTAGFGIEQWSKRMMADNEPLKGFIANVLGSVVVEAAIDDIQQKLSYEMESEGLKITNRYSPGYCGWPTEEQHRLFSLLPKDNCGIRLTDSALMQPIKSVSGFIGIGANVRFNPYTCQLCDASFCVYRNKKDIRKLEKLKTSK